MFSSKYEFDRVSKKHFLKWNGMYSPKTILGEKLLSNGIFMLACVKSEDLSRVHQVCELLIFTECIKVERAVYCLYLHALLKELTPYYELGAPSSEEVKSTFPRLADIETAKGSRSIVRNRSEVERIFEIPKQVVPKLP